MASTSVITKPKPTDCAPRCVRLSASFVQISHLQVLRQKQRRAPVCQNFRGGARSILRARVIQGPPLLPGLA